MSEFNNKSYLYISVRGSGKSSIKLMEYPTYRDTYLLELSEEDLMKFVHEHFNSLYYLQYGFILSSLLSIGNRVFKYDLYDHEVTEITDWFSTDIDYVLGPYFEKYVNFIANKQTFKTSYHEIKESIWTLHKLFYTRAVPYVNGYWKYRQFGATVKVTACDKDGLLEVKCSIIPYKSWDKYFKKNKSKYF